MRNYDKVQLVAYGTVTSQPVRVLPPGEPGKTDYDADLTMRGATLCKVADWILSNHAPAVADPSVLKVLVVPEFYFRFGGPVATGAPPDTLNNSYPNAQNKISNMIGSVLVPHFSTDTWNDWIIVAGSVFWHVPAKDTTNNDDAYLNTSIVINGGQVPEDEPDTNDPATVPMMGRVSTNQKALMSHVDWSIIRGNDRRAWDAALNPMFETMLGDNTYLRWHRFTVGGKGNRGGRSIVLGVEVCLEHIQAGAYRRPTEGVLRVLRATEPTLPAPDVHVLTSCGMTLNAAYGVATDEGGVAMSCDGSKTRGNVPWPRADVRETEAVLPSGGRLLSASANTLVRFDLPDNLQVGAPYDTRTPKDAVSIWAPVDLP
jgi:hypothetical protein